MKPPLLTFVGAFLAALVLAGATGARTSSFQTANCNVATAP